MKNSAFPGQGLGVCPCEIFKVIWCTWLAGIGLVAVLSGCGGGSSGNNNVVHNTPVSVTVSANAKTVPAGGSMEVNASILNDTGGRGITWSVSCGASDCGSVTPPSAVQATYTAPTAPPVAALSVTISATSVADQSKSASVVVNVAPISIALSPPAATVAVGGTLSLTATVTSDPANGGVNWSLACGNDPCGTLSTARTASGASTTYTAPTTLPVGDLGVTVQAVAVSNDGIGATSTITVPGFTISITPNQATVSAGKTAQFTATVANDASHGGVTWAVACDAPPCGSVAPTSTPSGAPTTYTAPTPIPVTDQGVTLTATSATNSTASGQASVLIPGIDIGVAVDNSTVDARTTAQVIGTVSSDTPNKSISWSVSCDTAPCGSISPITTNSGTPTTYTAPNNAPVSDLAVNITATSAMNANATTVLAINVPAIGVSVVPNAVLLPENATQNFTATVTHDPATAGVTWTLSDQDGTACSPGCGTAMPPTTASGASTVATAPATLPASPVAILTATSVTDISKSAGASITISTGTVKVVPSTLKMGTVLTGRSSTPKVTTLSNTGPSPLNVTSIAITGTAAADFTQTNNCGTGIAASASCTITVTFKPSAVGTRNATVLISDSSADSPQKVSLVGSGKQIHFSEAAKTTFIDTAARALPAPMGTDAVGTRVIRLEDSGRVDPYLTNGAKRELMVRFWYPTTLQHACQVADYAPAAVWTYFSQLAGVSLPHVKTNSCWKAPATPGPHPVVVFSPGYTATFTDYSYLFEDLASRGYIVAAVDHTYEATAVEFPDGRLEKSLMGSHIGGTLRGDDTSISFAVYVRVGDLRFVVGELSRLNTEANSPFAGRMDLARVGVAGHSMGGASAFLIAEHDSRIKTSVLLDATTPAGFLGRTEKATLVLRGNTAWSSDECHLWKSLRGPRIAVTLENSDHVAPSDAVWLAPNAVATGNLSVHEYMATVRESVARFLDLHLRGNAETRLLSSPFAERAGLAITANSQVPASCRQF